jgi:hypothetical protein
MYCIKDRVLVDINDIKQAKSDIENAEVFFNSCDPDMVDVASLRLTAAIKTYDILMQKAKDTGLKNNIVNIVAFRDKRKYISQNSIC